jgi:hypothetical protein
LDDPQVQRFIRHDALTHTIHLFLRTAPRRPYADLGRLNYLAHDAEREHPMYFQWQRLDWPLPSGVAVRMGLALQVVSEDSAEGPAAGGATRAGTPGLTMTAPAADRPRSPWDDDSRLSRPQSGR